MSESEDKTPKFSGGLGSNDKEIKSVKFRRKLSLMIGGGVLALLLLVLTVGQIMGFSYFGFKRPSQKVAVRTVVCDSNIVSRYNDNGSSDKDKEIIQQEIEKLVDEIAAKPNVDEDPTCQYILFWNAISKDDQETAKAALDHIRKAHDEGIFADNNLSVVASPDSMKYFIQDDENIVEGQG